ncbi:PACE efflux transporter [Halarcobacter sp.]|uniref:PACE efflux transporter n=1 Tax=Halarcobacter TaxID=2321115 RepID=UPI003A912655
MSFKERLIHSILFEILLVIIFTLLLKFITKDNITTVFTLTISLTLIAVIWNFIYNWIFDKFVTGPREDRSFKIRCIHAILFEFGLLFPTIPVIAYSLKIGIIEAFILDIGFVAFVLVFTVVYNYIYDRVRLVFIKSS